MYSLLHANEIISWTVESGGQRPEDCTPKRNCLCYKIMRISNLHKSSSVLVLWGDEAVGF